MGSGAMKHALQPAGEKAASSPAATAVTEATEVMEEEEDEEAIYEAHREELLAMLRSGGQAKLQARTPGGVGLLNQGATCYMNSLLQSLFNIPEFRLAVYQFEHDPQLHGDAARCIPMQLQRLFAQLQLSKASAVSTKELTAACGFSGRDAMEQHDVQELCRVLFDALEKSSSLLAKVIQDLYAGQRTYYIKCREEVDGNAYESKRRETYLDLQIPIQDCKSLPEALHKFLEPEVLSGDNQWFCEQLGRKVDALSGTTVDSLPQILCLHLLRFVFDMQTARRRKLTELLEIPLDLDLGFMKGGQYHLSAVCLHSGTAHGGHYHSFIRDPSGEWKDANDSRVTILGQQQCDSLFSGERPALHSSDAYFLLYRAEGAGSPPKVQDGEVPGRAEIFEENQRLQQLQRVYELHRRLLEVKIFVPCAAELFLRSYVSAQLHGLVEPVEAQEMCVSIKTLDRQPESLLRRAQKALSEMDADWAKVPLASARLYELDRRGLPGRPLEELEQVKELLLCEGSDWGGLEPTFLCLWDNELTAPSTAPGRVAALRLAAENKAAKASAEPASAQAGYNDQVKSLEETYELGQEEMPDLFADTAPTRPVGGSASPLLRDVRLAAAARWSLPVDGVVLVAMSGMQAGHELKDDAATLLECGCAGDVLCVELMEGPGVPRAVQLFEEKRNTAQVFFNHPDRPQYTEEFPALAISKDASLEQLKGRIAAQLQLAPESLHLARSQHAPAMFKDETRSLRQAGLAEAGSVFVGHGAPCAPEEVLLKVVLYCYDKGKPLQVRDAFTFPARGDSSVRSLREALLQPLATWAKSQADLEVEIPSTWKRLRLRDFQAGKGHAVLRDLRTLRSALLGLSDGRQVAVQVMDQDEELGLDDMVILLRPWRVQEARLYAPSELVVTKNQSLAEFQDKLTERFKGLLKGGEEDKENALPTEDSLEIVAAHATGPPLTVKRCETLKWADSRLSPGAERVEKPLADFKEVRDGVTLVVRSRAAEAPAAQAVPKKGTGKGPATAATAAAAAAEKKKSKPWASAQASGRERGLVIQVSHPEACAEDQSVPPV